MSQMLSSYTDSRDNNFNLLRFIAASLVLYSHSYALVTGDSATEPPRALLGMSWGNIAVDVFFITSGFLIASSLFARGNLLAFAWARILRIYPALIVAMLFCVFVVGLVFTKLPASEYLTEKGTYRYLIKNSLLFFGIEYRLPGVFDELPSRAINGSLWTLPYEVKMYTWLAALGTLILFIQRFISRALIKPYFVVIALVALCAHFFNHFSGSDVLTQSVSYKYYQLFAMFFVGTACFVCREHIPMNKGVFWACVAALAASMFTHTSFFIVYFIAIPYLIFYLSYVPGGRVRDFNKFGDYSYGLYIYAYPVQQMFIAVMPNMSVAENIVYSYIGTFVLAYLSWNLIEKRALKMKNSYVLIENLVHKLRA